MADSSLDQFFAKKDKSKKKTKGMATTDPMGKKTEEAGKNSDKSAKKDREKQENSTGKVPSVIASLEQADEEWNDFEEEKEVDYSGLRIQALTITEKEKEEEALRDQQDEDGEDGCPSSGDQQSGPWKMSAAAAQQALAAAQAEPEPEPEVPPPRIEPEPKEAPKAGQPKAAYVPPHLRSGGGSRSTAGGSSAARRLGGGRQTYDFTSEDQFPTLGAAVETPRWGPARQGPEVPDRSFTSVKHGLRNREDPSQQHIQLDLENKYSALHQGDGN
ncbi:hypothetical protein HPB47_027585 [Ixodes persulcatus]|uniref:Uncharacterized protein n=1 Tax=Ixodes persulcatus TaxID=34615 RepID=A0AC60PX16_IXOPE|nr:hypothetical protein HPB47_027585 [Ixodes persulcatus]